MPEDGSEVGKSLPLPIKTPRLVIRRLAPGDWKDLMELTAAEELFQYTAGRPLEEEEVLRWLESDAHVKLTTPNQTFYLAMETREPAKLIGYIGLTQTDPQHLQADLSIFVNKAFQRQGLLWKRSMPWWASASKASSCTASPLPATAGTRRPVSLFEKLGLRREGEFLKDHLLHGEWTNTVWYAALREEYSAEGAAEAAAKTNRQNSDLKSAASSRIRSAAALRPAAYRAYATVTSLLR